NLITAGWNELVLSVSEDVESSLKKATAGKEISVQTLLNGVDTAKFDDARYDKSSAKKALSIPGNAPVVGTVAVFRDQKRLHLWLDLAKKISEHFPEAYFILVGDGPHFEALRQQATELGIAEKTIFPGRLEEVRPWLAAMDVYLMTSEFEGLPIAMLEAMSMRLPIVSTTAGGIGEVVRTGEEGFLAPVHDYTALLQPLLQLLKNENLRKQTGTNARRRVETAFSIERMARELETVYLDILKKKDQK
ncbi:MAG TPA: glycosyltransferase family 4 protein, partial [Saprospiraceae bacterium]|nr:glycosyltransferase family 4 protein [Saprospiraceae bacterium]